MPDNENMDKLHPELKGFCDCVFNHKPSEKGEGIYKEVYRLAQLEDEPDKQATETVTVEEEVIEVIDGKAVQKKVTKTKEVPVYDELPCVDANGDQICDICNEKHVEFPIVQPKTVKVPRMIPGKKVSDADKARLAELMAKL